MFKENWAEKKIIIEQALIKELDGNDRLNQTLYDSMKYSLTADGKRLRPFLLMAAADTVGVNGEKFLTVACALEMIHTYSLIHDDLPVMDNDDYRRGKLTNHKVFGPSVAMLAGDALLTLAFEVMTRQKDVEPYMLLAVVNEISIAAGAIGMVGGQMIDFESEGKSIDMSELKMMHMGKTGALFRAAIRSGAILAGANEEELNCLTNYADNFGLAFQITDDILDFVGDEAIIGKPVGSDSRNNKSTYVTLTSLQEARSLAQEAVNNAKSSLDIFGEKGTTLIELADYLISRDK